MKNDSKRKSGKKAGKGGGGSRAIVYTGSNVPRGQFSGTENYKIRITAYAVVQSAAITGNIALNWANNPSGFMDWATVAALFFEYRVLTHRWIWVPLYKHFGQGANTLLQAPMVMSISRDPGVGNPTNVASLWDNAGATVHHISDQQSITVKANGIPDMGWIETRTPGSTWVVQQAVDGLSVGTFYGTVFQELLVEFRGRF